MDANKKALADLFSCIGAGDLVSTKALLESKSKAERAALLSATNPAGITLLQHACHAGQAAGVSMLLEEVREPACVRDTPPCAAVAVAPACCVNHAEIYIYIS